MTARQAPRNRIGRVLSTTGDGEYVVEVGGGTVPAYLSDRATNVDVAVGTLVTLLPLMGGYEIVSARTGPTGGGGVILGPELLSNGDFEGGSTGTRPNQWTYVYNYLTGEPNPLTLTTDAPLEGTACALVTGRPSPDWAHNSVLLRESPVRVDSGSQYRFSGYANAAGADMTGLSVGLEVLTAVNQEDCGYFNPNATFQVVVTLASPGGAWPVLQGDFTVPAGHEFARVGLRTSAPSGADFTVRWDAISLRQRIT